MDLVEIYGPPGVGKLTVAKELSRLTGYELFHNHLTLNYVSAVFDWDDTFWNLVREFRASIVEAAAREAVSLIFTFVYPMEEDEDHLARLAQSVERYGGRVCPVQLLCDQVTLDQRVQSDERAELDKVTSVEELHALMERDPRMFERMSDRESLCIDNTELAPAEVARRVIAYYGLDRKLSIAASS
jgi:hypothetical protein